MSEIMSVANITATLNEQDVLSGALVDSRGISGSLSVSSIVSGSISSPETLSANLSGMEVLLADITLPRQVGGDPYQGDYVVTPKANSQTVLETRGKTMSENVTVVEIPYFETSNISGNTVYIANEV